MELTVLLNLLLKQLVLLDSMEAVTLLIQTKLKDAQDVMLDIILQWGFRIVVHVYQVLFVLEIQHQPLLSIKNFKEVTSVQKVSIALAQFMRLLLVLEAHTEIKRVQGPQMNAQNAQQVNTLIKLDNLLANNVLVTLLQFKVLLSVLVLAPIEYTQLNLKNASAKQALSQLKLPLQMTLMWTVFL